MRHRRVRWLVCGAVAFGPLAACRAPARPYSPAAEAHPVATPSAKSPAVRTTRLWLRLDADARSELGADLSADDQRRMGTHGRWKAIPYEPVEVDWLPDWSLRVPGNPDPVRLRDEVWWMPKPNRAIGLFVQRTVDLHLDSPDGPVFGKALAGAFLPIYEPGPRTTEVVLLHHWAKQLKHGNPWTTNLSAFVDSDALGLAPPEGPTWPPEAGDYFDWHLSLSLEPEGPPFTDTICGAIHVLASDGSHVQVSQYRDGIWVTGWTHKPHWRRGNDRCLPRVVEVPSPNWPLPVARPTVPPRDYVAVPDDPAIEDPLGPLLRRGGALYVLRGWGDDVLTCVEWQVKPAVPKKDGRGLPIRVSELRQGKDDPVAYELTYAERRGPVLAQLSVRPEDCSAHYAIVAATPDQISLVGGFYPWGITAYHPDDREDFYLTKAACKAAAVRMSGSEPGLGRIFSEGC
jgi:hypothetical protein